MTHSNDSMAYVKVLPSWTYDMYDLKWIFDHFVEMYGMIDAQKFKPTLFPWMSTEKPLLFLDWLGSMYSAFRQVHPPQINKRVCIFRLGTCNKIRHPSKLWKKSNSISSLLPGHQWVYWGYNVVSAINLWLITLSEGHVASHDLNQ